MVRSPTDAGPRPSGPTILRFERRRSTRSTITGTAEVQRIGGGRFGQSHRLVLQDYSDGGLAARSDTVVEPGTLVWIVMDCPGASGRRGVVRRCVPCGNGYRIAVQFDLALAA